MGRAPCCEKMGLKKGPWSPEEDQILISFIRNHGHSNWRALPKQAGLLRCGKSCRLRWTNYLRPDIKRGNFTIEEEDSIIKLHEILGNRWSAIAAKLPGRTDNEIKNVWHTHLKKRLANSKITTPKSEAKRKRQSKPRINNNNNNNNFENNSDFIEIVGDYSSMSPSQQSSSEISSITDSYYNNDNMVSVEAVPPIDDSFWSETTKLTENSNSSSPLELELEFSVADSEVKMEIPMESNANYGQCFDEDMEFWYDVFVKAGGISELPEF